MRVRRALTRAARGVPEATKTAAGRCDIKLLVPASAALQRQNSLTRVRDDGALFRNPDSGNRWTDAQIYRNWGHALKRAGVRYRRPYQTHHTYASMMLSSGEHPMWVVIRWDTATGQ